MNAVIKYSLSEQSTEFDEHFIQADNKKRTNSVENEKKKGRNATS